MVGEKFCSVLKKKFVRMTSDLNFFFQYFRGFHIACCISQEMFLKNFSRLANGILEFVISKDT